MYPLLQYHIVSLPYKSGSLLKLRCVGYFVFEGHGGAGYAFK